MVLKKFIFAGKKALKGAKVSDFRGSGSVPKFHGSATLVIRVPYLRPGPRTKTRAKTNIVHSKISCHLSFPSRLKVTWTHLSWSLPWAGSRGEWRSGEYSGQSHPHAGQGTEEETTTGQVIWKEQCCGSGIFIPDPGSWFLTHPGSRI